MNHKKPIINLKPFFERYVWYLLEPIFILVLWQQNIWGKLIASVWFITSLLILIRDRKTLVIVIVGSLLNKE